MRCILSTSHLSQQHTNVVFLKVDVDRNQAVAQRYRVRAMPTFLFLKNKNVVDTLQGADPNRLTALVKQHSSGASSAFSGSGQTLSGNASGSGSSNSFGVRGIAGLTDGHVSFENFLPLLVLGAYLVYLFLG